MDTINRYKNQEYDDLTDTDKADAPDEPEQEDAPLPRWPFPQMWTPNPGKKQRAGITTSKGRKRDKRRAKMARASRRRNRSR